MFLQGVSAERNGNLYEGKYNVVFFTYISNCIYSISFKNGLFCVTTSDRKFMVWGSQKVQARFYFMYLNFCFFFLLAIYFYRQAVQLVPDIEFRIKDFTSYNLASGRFLDTFSIVTHLTDFQMMQFL